MQKILEFIKRSLLLSKILFILWFLFGVVLSFGETNVFFPFTAILLIPALLIELFRNPVFHSGDSKLFAFLRSTRVVSRILIYLWLFCLVMDISDGINEFVVFPVMSVVFMLPVFLIEFNCNIQLKRNVNNNGSDFSNQSSKSWIATFLLCLFTGHLGVHRFYVGKVGTGIVWLFTMGCFGFGYLIDLVIIATGNFKDKNGQPIKHQHSTVNRKNTFTKAKENATAVYEKTSNIGAQLNQKKEQLLNDGKQKLQQWKEVNQLHKQTEAKKQQLHKIVSAPFDELKEAKIKPFGESATLAEFHQVQVAGFLRIVRESLDLINKTTNPSTFFGRYETAVQNAKRTIEIMKQYDASEDAEELLESLVDEKESLVEEFIDRCYDKGILSKVKDEILQYRKHLTDDNIEYLQDLLKDDGDGFSDIVLDGTEEITQSIPSANIETLGRNSTSRSGLTISIKPVISRDENGDFSIDFDFDDDSPYSSSKFIKDMAKFENKVGKEAPFIPFMQYWPSYDSMTKQQKDWYFYWRSQVRKGIYLNTDLSYIFVHVYELLSGYGWTNAQDGYDQLIALWINYRNEHIRLDNYLVGWLFDFAQLHKLEYAVPEGIEITLPYQLAIRDLLIDTHSDEKPLKLPFPLIDALCDYSLAGSKFYKDGHQLLMNEAIPRVVALADAALIKKKGKGILETYGPNRPKKQTYYAFQSANCVHANKRMDISVKGYTSSQKLRGYINELVRYAENVLRELYDCRGRLRGVTLDDETASLVKAFLKKEYSPNRKPIEPEKKKEVKLDFESINELRNQSDAVRDALEVTEEKIEAKELLTDLDAVKEIFVSMPPYCRMLIDEMRSKSWEMEYNSSVQASIEKINELSGMQLACSIVVVEGNTLILEDDYRDEFNYIYEHLSEIEIPESSEEKDTISKFDLTALSDEMKQLLETLTPTQEEILHIILSQENMSQRIEEIANAEMSMPEILIDEINDIATQYIGDILIDTFDAEMSVLEQYVNELKEAMK